MYKLSYPINDMNTTGSIGNRKLCEVVCGSNALRKPVSGNECDERRVSHE